MNKKNVLAVIGGGASGLIAGITAKRIIKDNGRVVIFERISTAPYQMITHVADVDKIANVEKKVPMEWITSDGMNVNDKITEYIRPLIQGEMTQIMVNGLPKHIVLK